MKISVPVRFTSTTAAQVEYQTITVETERTAFLLVDCAGDCGPLCNQGIEKHIAPTLQAVRSVGIKPIFLYGEPLPDGPHSIPGELHWTRRDEQQPPVSWQPSLPTWALSIRPLPDEPTIAKSAQSGFVNTYLDRYLRAWGPETLLVVGFSFKSCLFYTLVSAFEHNYRRKGLGATGPHQINRRSFGIQFHLRGDRSGLSSRQRRLTLAAPDPASATLQPS
jgi:nicotinamidase-related amidase